LRFWGARRPPVHADGLTLSEAAVCIALSGKPPVCADGNEVNIKTLVSPTILLQAMAVALKVFEVYPPASFPGIVGCKVVLSTRRPLADFSDVVADLKGQIVYVMGIPRGITTYGTPFRFSLKFIAKQQQKSQQHGPDCHLTLLVDAGRNPVTEAALLGNDNENQPTDHDRKTSKRNKKIEAIPSHGRVSQARAAHTRTMTAASTIQFWTAPRGKSRTSHSPIRPLARHERATAWTIDPRPDWRLTKLGHRELKRASASPSKPRVISHAGGRRRPFRGFSRVGSN
jgi:hypothetical protein